MGTLGISLLLVLASVISSFRARHKKIYLVSLAFGLFFAKILLFVAHYLFDVLNGHIYDIMLGFDFATIILLYFAVAKR